MNRLYRLLAFGYFPKELPPVFSTKKFAKEIKVSENSISNFCSDKWSMPSVYLLKQRTRYRRPLSILNPNAIVPLAECIANNYVEIKRHVDQSNLSISKPRFKRKTKFFRAVSAENIGSSIKEKKLILRTKYPVILKCDLKNYYRSVYTHIIPWALHGRSYSK